MIFQSYSAKLLPFASWMIVGLFLIGCNSEKQPAQKDNSKSSQSNKSNSQQKNPNKDNKPPKTTDKNPKELTPELVEKLAQEIIDEMISGNYTTKKPKANDDVSNNQTSVNKQDTQKKPVPKNDTNKTSDSGKNNVVKKSVPKDYEPVKDNPFNPLPNATPEELVEQLLTMIQESPRVQKRPGFISALLKTVDLILQSQDASTTQRNFAILIEFKALHMAAVLGDEIADRKLTKFANGLTNQKSKKITAWIALVKMERRVLDAEKLKDSQLPELLKDLKNYLANDKLRITNNHLRMAGNTVGIINRLEKKQREPLLKELGKLYAKSIDSDLKNYGLQLGQKPAVTGGSLIGKEMKIVAAGVDGARYDLKDERGKVMIVDFWASWCGPCKAEIPRVKKILDKYAAQNFGVIGVSLDRDAEKLKDYLFDHPLPWNTLNGPLCQTIAKKHGVRGIPALFLIDKYGKIVAQSHSVEAFADKIDDLLKVEYKVEEDKSEEQPKKVPSPEKID